MSPEHTEAILQRVIDYCLSIVNLENRPSDDHIETAEAILKIINQELDKK